MPLGDTAARMTSGAAQNLQAMQIASGSLGGKTEADLFSSSQLSQEHGVPREVAEFERYTIQNATQTASGFVGAVERARPGTSAGAHAGLTPSQSLFSKRNSRGKVSTLRAAESPDIRKKLASASVGASNLLGRNLRRGTKQGADYNKLGKNDKVTSVHHANGTDEA